MAGPHPWGDSAEDLIPFLFFEGHLSKTGSGWLGVGCEAGKYCGETGGHCRLGYHLLASRQAC